MVGHKLLCLLRYEAVEPCQQGGPCGARSPMWDHSVRICSLQLSYLQSFKGWVPSSVRILLPFILGHVTENCMLKPETAHSLAHNCSPLHLWGAQPCCRMQGAPVPSITEGSGGSGGSSAWVWQQVFVCRDQQKWSWGGGSQLCSGLEGDGTWSALRSRVQMLLLPVLPRESELGNAYSSRVLCRIASL